MNTPKHEASKRVYSFVFLTTCLFFSLQSCGFSENKQHLSSTKKDSNKACRFNTKGIASANGLNMDIYYPCDWTNPHTNDDRPDVIKQVGIMPENTNVNFAFTFVISKFKQELTQEMFQEIRKEIYLEGRSQPGEETLFSDTLTISGVQGGKTITKYKTSGGQIVYNLNVQLFSQNNLIELIYLVGGPTNSEVAEAFEKRKTFFMELANKTRFR